MLGARRGLLLVVFSLTGCATLLGLDDELTFDGADAEADAASGGQGDGATTSSDASLGDGGTASNEGGARDVVVRDVVARDCGGATCECCGSSIECGKLNATGTMCFDGTATCKVTPDGGLTGCVIN